MPEAKKRIVLCIGEVPFMELPIEMDPPARTEMLSTTMKSAEEDVVHLLRFAFAKEEGNSEIWSLAYCKSVNKEEWDTLVEAYNVSDMRKGN